ncbi:MAG: hypothetical protein L6R40_005897 [Gallowayella cf. fulva]|nr:MAG: hypothetical protein L6R40_005897 [Xanthomendoza cf. fulva]
MQHHQRPLSAPPTFSHPCNLSVSGDILPYHLSPTASRKSSISGSSSDSEDILTLWQTSPPSRTHSVTEGIEPHADPERYVPQRPLKCLYAHIFRTDIFMNQKTGTKETSPPVSPRGTITEDTLDVVKREQGVCLSDRQFELNEKKKEMRMKKNQRFRDLVSESPREMKRKERMRRKREAFRLPVAEWEIVKQAFGGRDEDLDSDGDEEGDEGLGLWLKIALRRGRDQRQVEAERSEFGSGGEDDAMSAEVLERTTSFRSSKKRARDSSVRGAWERDETQRLRRVESNRDLRGMNKRYDPEAGSAYSRSTGTLIGEASSSSLID